MERGTLAKVAWISLPAAMGLLLLVACDQDWPGDWDGKADTSVPDIVADTGSDTTPPDVPDDTTPGDTMPADTAPDPVEEDPGEPCTGYPPEPWGFEAVGQTPGPAAWPSSLKGSTEISALAHADLQQFYCDPEVESVLVFLATMS
jgi:hypothetical protein